MQARWCSCLVLLDAYKSKDDETMYIQSSSHSNSVAMKVAFGSAALLASAYTAWAKDITLDIVNAKLSPDGFERSMCSCVRGLGNH